MLKVAIIVGVAALLLAGGAALFIESGVYNIGADDHHTQPVLAIIEQLRERSIAVRASSIEAYDVSDPQRVAAGGRRYAALCVGCHLAPGVPKSDIRPGLYPHPPNLAQGEELESRRAFWIVKHGIKMSAMPAWGKTLDDMAIWDVVAFLRKMPGMTPEAYQRMTAAPARAAGIAASPAAGF
ncbi:MAG TPA: cytochrome c [Steroidobacteraceae bacterium]|jgi:mono/diheme cytochrome c family protein